TCAPRSSIAASCPKTSGPPSSRGSTAWRWEPRDCYSGGREVVLERLLPLDADRGEDVVQTAALLRGRGAWRLVPFARDPFGNFFCFRCARHGPDAIVYWEHETGGVTTICKTFSDLLASLHFPRGGSTSDRAVRGSEPT
ncbi:MAG: SMI1/KNR4 family protein, partial [Myxococcota bacterium]|nr:SMI1/KNR4 family protein [Myxococcota bacterium]